MVSQMEPTISQTIESHTTLESSEWIMPNTNIFPPNDDLSRERTITMMTGESYSMHSPPLDAPRGSQPGPSHADDAMHRPGLELVNFPSWSESDPPPARYNSAVSGVSYTHLHVRRRVTS